MPMAGRIPLIEQPRDYKGHLMNQQRYHHHHLPMTIGVVDFLKRLLATAKADRLF